MMTKEEFIKQNSQLEEKRLYVWLEQLDIINSKILKYLDKIKYSDLNNTNITKKALLNEIYNITSRQFRLLELLKKYAWKSTDRIKESDN